MRKKRNYEDKGPRQQVREEGDPRKHFSYDSGQRTRTHISTMRHQQCSGEATACQVSPTAEDTKYRDEERAFQEGAEGGGGRWGKRARTEHLDQICEARSLAGPRLKGLALLAFSF